MKNIDIEKLVTMYTVDDMSLREIASVFNTSKETIKRSLIKEGIPIVNKVYKNKGASGKNNGMWREDIDSEQIINLYQNTDKSYTQIADELGISRKSVKIRLEMNNVDIIKKIRKDNIGIKAPMNKVYYKYKVSAEKRNYEFNIDVDIFHELITKPCHYCGDLETSVEKSKAGFEYKYTGLDRIDNSKGYTIDNVVPCCKICNQMKSNLSYKDFIDKIKLIGENFF